MAKVIRPLSSDAAMGKYGTIVFDGRGYARPYQPNVHQPNSAAQGRVRQTLAAVQKALKLAGENTRAALRSQAPLYGYPSYNWNACALSLTIGEGSEAWNAHESEFTALDATTRAAWDTAAEAAGISDTEILYAASPFTAGLAAFCTIAALAQLVPTIEAATTPAAKLAALKS